MKEFVKGPIKEPMGEKYDSIVAGAGFAGVLTAAYLAFKGQKVLLVEKSNNPGGLFQSIRCFGREMFLGAHHIGGLCRGNFIDILFQSVGIEMEDYFSKTTKFAVWMKNKRYELPLSLEELSGYLKKLYPEEKDIELFLEEIKTFQRYFNENDEKGQLKMFMQTSRISYREYLKQYFKDEELIQLLCFLGPGYGGVSAEDSAFSNLSLLVTYTIGAYYIKGGNEALLKYMISSFLEHGGDLMYNSEVIDILYEERRATGITYRSRDIDKNYTVYGANIIFASNPFSILKKKFPELRTVKKSLSLKCGPSVTRIYLRLQEYPFDSGYPSDVTYMGDYSLTEMEQHILLKHDTTVLPVCMICFPNLSESRREEDEKLCMLTFLSYENNNSLAGGKEQLLQMIREQLPVIGECIQDIITVDCELYKKVTNTDTGSVFGWKRDGETVLTTNNFAPRIQGFEKIYLVGNWSTDFGIYGAIRSSKKVCDLILKQF